MAKRLAPKLLYSGNMSYPNVQLTRLPYFKTEQSSNDYICSLCKRSLFKESLQAFELLLSNTNFKLSSSTYAHLISACASLRSLEYGRKVHHHIMSNQSKPDVILQNHIINMYGKCGLVKEAKRVFDGMLERNAVSWTSLIAGYAHNGEEDSAIGLYFDMVRAGFIPDQYTLGSVIKACSNFGDIILGMQLHTHVIKLKFGSHLIAQNALISMYVRFEEMVDASLVFSEIRNKDLTSWGSMISGLSQLGFQMESLHCFREMLQHGIYCPNEFIFGSVVNACGCLSQPEYGRQIHGMCVKFGFGSNNFAGCSLTDMYARCGFLDSSKAAFSQVDCPDVVSWNAIISALSRGDTFDEILSFFSQMRHLGLTPNEITVRSLLCACTSPGALHQGEQLHAYVIKSGFNEDIQVYNTLLTMYAECSHVGYSFIMFKELVSKVDLVSWNLLMTVCLQNNHAKDVFRLFSLMCVSLYKPDCIMFTNLLKAAVQMTSLEMGKQVHSYALKSGFEVDISVSNGLIDLYTKFGLLGSARLLFDSIENSDVVSWSTLILGYAQSGYGDEALKLFSKMRSLHVQPNEVTFLGVLTACSHIGYVEEGLQIYQTIETEHKIRPTREHCSCIVDLLARAGRLKEAEAFVKQMPVEPDIVVWKTLLSACRMHPNAHIGKWAAENILKIDPFNSSAYVLLCNLYASNGNWEEFARIKSLMKSRGVKKLSGQSWIEVHDKIHVFSSGNADIHNIYTILQDLYLKMLDDGYHPGKAVFGGLCDQQGEKEVVL